MRSDSVDRSQSGVFVPVVFWAPHATRTYKTIRDGRRSVQVKLRFFYCCPLWRNNLQNTTVLKSAKTLDEKHAWIAFGRAPSTAVTGKTDLPSEKSCKSLSCNPHLDDRSIGHSSMRLPSSENTPAGDGFCYMTRMRSNVLGREECLSVALAIKTTSFQVQAHDWSQ